MRSEYEQLMKQREEEIKLTAAQAETELKVYIHTCYHLMRLVLFTSYMPASSQNRSIARAQATFNDCKVWK